VLKALKAALGDSFERGASVSSVLERADKAAKIAKQIKKRIRAAPSSASAAAAGTVLREGRRRRGRRAALTVGVYVCVHIRMCARTTIYVS
jgi:hypothetical protein